MKKGEACDKLASPKMPDDRVETQPLVGTSWPCLLILFVRGSYFLLLVNCPPTILHGNGRQNSIYHRFVKRLKDLING